MTTYTIALELTKEVQRVKRPVCVRINENETQTIKAHLTRYFKPCTVDCDKAQLHMLRDDGTWSHVDATCTGDSVECAIKAVQLGKTAQNACAYFFFQKGTKTETTESFQLRVERAAIDTEASDAFFDTTMNAIATKWGAYENAAEAQESARKDAESKRVTAEQERISAEQARVTAEQKRQQAEQERDSAESDRDDNEDNRTNAESNRLSAEERREQAENRRVNREADRINAEERRAQAESARQSSESTRTSAEQSRQSRFNEMLDAAQNVKFRILSASEVDSEGKPTITGSVGIIYLVKAQSAQETKANHYTEWIYLENRWELFGSTAPTADPIEVDDIDKLAQGTTIAGNRVLNATGLSALWSKLNQRFSRINNSLLAAQGTADDAKQASANNASSIQSLSSKQSTFEQQASNQLRALRTWAESTLESKMQERYNAGFNKGKQEGGEDIKEVVFNSSVDNYVHAMNYDKNRDAFIDGLANTNVFNNLFNKDINRVLDATPGYKRDKTMVNRLNDGSKYNGDIYYINARNQYKNLVLANYEVSSRAQKVSDAKAKFDASSMSYSAYLNNPSALLSLSDEQFLQVVTAFAMSDIEIRFTCKYADVIWKLIYVNNYYGNGELCQVVRETHDKCLGEGRPWEGKQCIKVFETAYNKWYDVSNGVAVEVIDSVNGLINILSDKIRVKAYVEINPRLGDTAESFGRHCVVNSTADITIHPYYKS